VGLKPSTHQSLVQYSTDGAKPEQKVSRVCSVPVFCVCDVWGGYSTCVLCVWCVGWLQYLCFVCVMCGVATVPVFCVYDVWGGYSTCVLCVWCVGGYSTCVLCVWCVGWLRWSGRDAPVVLQATQDGVHQAVTSPKTH